MLMEFKKIQKSIIIEAKLAFISLSFHIFSNLSLSLFKKKFILSSYSSVKCLSQKFNLKLNIFKQLLFLLIMPERMHQE